MRPVYGGERPALSPLDVKDPITLEVRLPTLEEYRALCAAVGWEEVINFEAAPLSLSRSLFGVTVLDYTPGREQAVGMGRIVGDGAIYFYIQDIVVRPEYQGQGIGRLIVEKLMAWLRSHAPDRSFVGLFASEGRDSFYAHFGFLRHPALTGMFCVIHEDPDMPAG